MANLGLGSFNGLVPGLRGAPFGLRNRFQNIQEVESGMIEDTAAEVAADQSAALANAGKGTIAELPTAVGEGAAEGAAVAAGEEGILSTLVGAAAPEVVVPLLVAQQAAQIPAVQKIESAKSSVINYVVDEVGELLGLKEKDKDVLAGGSGPQVYYDPDKPPTPDTTIKTPTYHDSGTDLTNTAVGVKNTKTGDVTDIIQFAEGHLSYGDKDVEVAQSYHEQAAEFVPLETDVGGVYQKGKLKSTSNEYTSSDRFISPFKRRRMRYI